MEINLFDTTFAHIATVDGIYSHTPNTRPKNIKYLKNLTEFDGISVFTDTFLFADISHIKSKYKIGWLIEPEEINPRPYKEFETIMDKFDFCMTYDEKLLNRYPNKTKLYVPWTTWILDENRKIYPKSKNISMIFSNKQYASGHKLRHRIANEIKEIDLYGTGTGTRFELKDNILKDYKFSIVVENVKTKYGMSEKLFDCFATGTVPIYWGCTNIEEYFDTKGILIFDTIEELLSIIYKINKNHIKYESMLNSVSNNFDTLKKYNSIEDWMYENIFKNL